LPKTSELAVIPVEVNRMNKHRKAAIEQRRRNEKLIKISGSLAMTGRAFANAVVIPANLNFEWSNLTKISNQVASKYRQNNGADRITVNDVVLQAVCREGITVLALQDETLPASLEFVTTPE